MSECPKCNKKLLTVKTYVEGFAADQEPYEADKEEAHDGISTDVSLVGEWCENCEAFVWLHVSEAVFVEK